MDSNPYAASKAIATAQDQVAKKPVAYLIMQIIMVLNFIVCVIMAVIVPLFRPDGGAGGSEANMWFTVVPLVFVSWWAGTIVYTIAKRRPSARWFSGATVLIMILWAVFKIFADNPLDASSSSYQAGRMTGGLFMLALECYWFYHLVFAEKAKRYLGIQEPNRT